jgi:hypothetical protein
VRIFNDTRPSALTAACAQVPWSSTEPNAHAIAVGRPAVRGASIIGARYANVQQVQGRVAPKSEGLKVQGSVMVAKRDLGGVRGVPPRGRPV